MGRRQYDPCMVMKGERYLIGVDLGGTNMQVAVIGLSGGRYSILSRYWSRTRAEQGQAAVLDRIVAGVDAACEQAGVRREQIAGAGIAAPSAIDIPMGMVIEAPNLEWANVPLRDIMAERLGMAVTVDNDVNAAVWAEHQLGAGRGHGDLLGVWVGTGVGGALVLNNALYYGPSFTAGELGHTTICPDNPQGQRTVEDICSRSGLTEYFAGRLGEFPTSVLHKHIEETGQLEPLDMDLLVGAMREHDPLVTPALERAAEILGIAIANCVTLLSLDCVVIGGGVVEALNAPFLERIRESFSASVFPHRLARCKLAMTELAGDAGLLGAALLAARGEK